MKNDKGITLVSLVIYIAVVIVVMAAIMRITTHFKNSMAEVADVSFETEFQKINLYLLDESKIIGNKIDEIVDGTKITFTKGNRYQYNETEKTIYLNDTIKVCENVGGCIFSEKTAENGKSVLSLTITINKIQKTVDYVMKSVEAQESEVDIDSYLMGASKVIYHLKVGDYVDYTPTTGTYKVADGEYGSGYTTTQGHQSFTTEVEESLKWRVLSIDEQTGEIELVSATAAQAETPLYLQGANGYNHAVDILNDLCEALYSKTVDGKEIAKARSINIEDIRSKVINNLEGNTTYNKEYRFSEYTATTAKKYPNLYAKEDGFYIQGIKQKNGIKESIGINDGVIENGITTYSTLTGFSDDNDVENSKDISVTYTYYYLTPDLNKNLGINTAPTGLIDNIKTQYWLASRCVYIYSTNNYMDIYFSMRISNEISHFYLAQLFCSTGNNLSKSYAVRPVVKLDATQFLDFTEGDGSKENPWGMK